jgi:hypothetical protein
MPEKPKKNDIPEGVSEADAKLINFGRHIDVVNGLPEMTSEEGDRIMAEAERLAKNDPY